MSILQNQEQLSLGVGSKLEPNEIDIFRKRLLYNISDLNLNKHRLNTHDYNQLINYHRYSLTILDNMINIRQVEANNPYNRNMNSSMGRPKSGLDSINPYESNLKVIYNQDGTTSLIASDEYAKKYKAEWENAFDDNLINPPSYTFPPNNCWATNRQKDNSCTLLKKV